MKNITLSIILVSICFINSYTQCSLPTAFSTMSINELNVNITNDGNIFSKKGNTVCGVEYPKRSNAQIQAKELATTPIFGGGIILSAYDKNELKVSSSITPTKSKYDFVAGPINSKTGKVIESSCNAFDKIWSITKTQIESFKSIVQNTAIFPIKIDKIEKNILEWPAKGNTRMDCSTTIEEDLAPFIDYNQNGIYDPENGDYPLIEGDLANFWVMNDLGAKHNSFENNKPLGVEVQMMAYQFINAPLNTSIIYKSKIIKKTVGDLDNFVFSLYVDPDLGNYNDDYLGCDSDKNYAFIYNGDNYDEVTEVGGYKKSAPILTTAFLSQPMGAFLSFPYTSGVQGFAPTSDSVCRFYMEGKTSLGNYFTVGNSGLNGTIPTPFVFSGNPIKKDEWSMLSEKIAPRDIKYLQSTKSINLKYNTPTDFDFMLNAFPIEDYNVNINRDSITIKIEAIKKQLHYNAEKCINIPQLITESDIQNVKLGKATVSKVINGAEPFDFKWSTGEVKEEITSKNPGIYNVIITDAKNCTVKATVAIRSDLLQQSTNAVNDLNQSNIITYNVINDELVMNNFNNLNYNNISIVDISGKEIESMEATSIVDSKISISQLNSGIYFLRLSNNEAIQNLKFLKN